MESLSNIKKHETNPFMVELKGRMYLQPRANMIIAKGEKLVNTETGEILKESTLIGRRKVVDKSQFAKIYVSEIGTLYELTKTAQNVFLYLTKVMDYDNKSFFNYVSQHEKVGYKTHSSALKGIRELINRGIIAPAIMPHYYWMNPTVVCKGERFAKYTEYITEEEAKREEQALLRKQGREFVNQLDSDTRTKWDRANRGEELNSNNENLTLNFSEKSPYIKQFNTEGGIDLIDPTTGKKVDK